jgi:hypothetical protein
MIAYTAQAEDDIRDHGVSAGFDAYCQIGSTGWKEIQLRVRQWSLSDPKQPTRSVLRVPDDAPISATAWVLEQFAVSHGKLQLRNLSALCFRIALRSRGSQYPPLP